MNQFFKTSRTISSSQLSDPDGSVLDSPVRSRLKIRPDQSVEEDEDDEEVFSMTTQMEKESMISEFRHRKGKRILPFSTSSAGQKNYTDTKLHCLFRIP
jgi:hypothetical protein